MKITNPQARVFIVAIVTLASIWLNDYRLHKRRSPGYAPKRLPSSEGAACRPVVLR